MTPFEELLQKERIPTISGILSMLCNQKTAEDIQKCVTEYENWFVVNVIDESVPRGQELAVARQNIGYIIGYVEPKEERDRLYQALNVSHPIFGTAFGRI